MYPEKGKQTNDRGSSNLENIENLIIQSSLLNTDLFAYGSKNIKYLKKLPLYIIRSDSFKTLEMFYRQ